MNAVRDWGHAKDYVKNMWLMLQKKFPQDYVISTNKSYTVKEFIEITYKFLGINIIWKGKKNKEIGLDKKNNKIIVRVNKKYFRPNEVEILRGNSKKAKKELKWKPTISLNQLVKEMIEYELKLQKKE